MAKAYTCDICGKVKTWEELWTEFFDYKLLANERTRKMRSTGRHICDECIQPEGRSGPRQEDQTEPTQPYARMLREEKKLLKGLEEDFNA